MAYACHGRYGAQDIAVVLEMPVDVLRDFNKAIERIVAEEKELSEDK